MGKIARIFTLVIAFAFLTSAPGHAQSLLRDAETEAFLRDISTPLFKAAGLTPSSVHMYLIHDDSINAFVTGGQNIFLHTGLILRADNVNQLRGVIAHETGHISGGHLARSSEAFEKAGATSIVSMVLGAAMIIAGGADAGMGMLMAGQQAAQRQVLSYSRVVESSTDQAGFKFLDANGITGKGMLEFFNKMRQQEAFMARRIDPYAVSHPLSTQRILKLQGLVEGSPHFNKPIDAEMNEDFLRLKAKLFGYIKGPKHTLNTYPLTDTSVAARYARTYAFHKAIEWDKALTETDALIKSEPDNPYFYEIKGQILFENGKVAQAIPYFKKAVDLKPRSPLILTAYAQSLIATDDIEQMKVALPYLKTATRLEPDNSFAWFNLAKVYSWLEMGPKASLASAERFYALGVAPMALRHAQTALKGLDENTPEWYRAQDIVITTKQEMERYNRSVKRRR